MGRTTIVEFRSYTARQDVGYTPRTSFQYGQVKTHDINSLGRQNAYYAIIQQPLEQLSQDHGIRYIRHLRCIFGYHHDTLT